MKQSSYSITIQIHPSSLGKRMLLGAAIALCLIGLFLAGNDYVDPAWPKFWLIKPLIIVPLAGAMGGACSYFLTTHSFQHGWSKSLAIILSMVIYIIGLWLGTVLGLDGTLWN